MTCEKCPYCCSKQMYESYEEDVWCEKGYGDGYTECHHILPYLRIFRNTLLIPYTFIKWKINKWKWEKYKREHYK